MPPLKPLVATLPVLLLATGCVGTVAHVATAPVRVTAKAVDWSTTSRSEADRNYGRRMRKAEAREGRERKAWARRCRGHEGDPDCREYTGFKASDLKRR
jgi:hypothetical protein